MPTAKEIMKKKVITLSPEMTVEEAGRLFMEKGISGAPVVDSEGRLTGIVTENDLITKNRRLHIPTILRIFDLYIAVSGRGEMEDEIRKMAAYLVRDIATKDVITISEETGLEDIATIMTDKRIHLLPVMRGGKMVGIVGRHEVLKAMAG